MESDANVDVAERRIVDVNRCFLRTLNRRDSEVSDAEGVVGLLLLHQVRQYLYFCTSTTSKLSNAEGVVGLLLLHQIRQYLYFCTSTASKLSTCSSTRFVTAM